jgi:hypothetical protein
MAKLIKGYNEQIEKIIQYTGLTKEEINRLYKAPCPIEMLRQLCSASIVRAKLYNS